MISAWVQYFSHLSVARPRESEGFQADNIAGHKSHNSVEICVYWCRVCVLAGTTRKGEAKWKFGRNHFWYKKSFPDFAEKKRTNVHRESDCVGFKNTFYLNRTATESVGYSASESWRKKYRGKSKQIYKQSKAKKSRWRIREEKVRRWKNQGKTVFPYTFGLKAQT